MIEKRPGKSEEKRNSLMEDRCFRSSSWKLIGGLPLLVIVHLLFVN